MLTSIVLPVAPVFHAKVPVQPAAVNVAFSPSQHTVLFEVIIGDAGGVFLLIVTGVLLLLIPQMFVHVTV